MKIAIIGSPRSGKTTFSNTFSGNVKHTDELISLGWSEASEKASLWFDDENIAVIEGVSVPRALRKWLARNQTGKPVDKVIILSHSFQELSDGQMKMAKGIVTVWNEIVKELLARGVEVEEQRLTPREPDLWDSAPLQSLSTSEADTPAEVLSTPPTSG